MSMTLPEGTSAFFVRSHECDWSETVRSDADSIVLAADSRVWISFWMDASQSSFIYRKQAKQIGTVLQYSRSLLNCFVSVISDCS